MTILHLRSTRCLLLLLSVSIAPQSQAATPRAEILWDTWGVPHIFAKDSGSLCRAFGWAQMESHGNLLLRLYGQARGRAAEYWGARYIDSDRWVRLMGIEERAKQWLPMQSADMRGCLESFAEGINAFATEHPDAVGSSEKVVLPVMSTDPLAHLQRLLHFTFISNPAMLQGIAPAAGSAGSNAWVIGPRRTSNGHVLLLANPHLAWSDLYTLYEAHLSAPGLNAYGSTFVGHPVLGTAFNDYLGWAHTVNTQDGADLYELTLAGGGYRWDNTVRQFDTEEQVLRVRQDDGSSRDQKLLIKRSIHGPVVSESKGKAIALRVVGLDRSQVFDQYWEMMRARDLAAFLRALRRMQLPIFSVLYGDRAGHIMYYFGGLTPKRPAGPYNWAGVVRGDTAATLWTETLPFEALPRATDPPTGWLQNCNDPPWHTTVPTPFDSTSFPMGLAPSGMELRAERSALLLRDHAKLSLDEMVRLKFSTHAELADRVLESLLGAAKDDSRPTVGRAAAVLAKWDRGFDTASRGAVLFETWVRELSREYRNPIGFAVPWSAASPLSTPSGLADLSAALTALERASQTVEKSYGALDVPWGDVNRVRLGDLDLPGNGAPGFLGVVRVLGYLPAPDDRRRQAGGDAYVAAIEFGSTIQARVVLAYGNSSQPSSKHRTDQIRMFIDGQLRPVWRTRSEIQAHLENREAF
jgi:acyl-homoserine-lactone acylase